MHNDILTDTLIVDLNGASNFSPFRGAARSQNCRVQATSFDFRLKPLPLPAHLHRLKGNSIKSIPAPRNSFDSKNTERPNIANRISVSDVSS